MSNKLNFVVIDDSKLDCFIAEKVIQNTGRNESIKSFMMASEALDYLRNAPVPTNKTVILVDIQMPLMNGFEFLDAFESAIPEDARSHYVVNLLSSSINETDMTRAKTYKSVNMFLNKPLTKNSLEEALKNT